MRTSKFNEFLCSTISHDKALSVLNRAGWQFAGSSGVGANLRRPGKEAGVSATLYYDNKTLKVFSDNSIFEAGKVYALKDWFCTIEYGGDYSRLYEDFNSLGIKPHVYDTVVKHNIRTKTSKNNYNGTRATETAFKKPNIDFAEPVIEQGKRIIKYSINTKLRTVGKKPDNFREAINIKYVKNRIGTLHQLKSDIAAGYAVSAYYKSNAQDCKAASVSSIELLFIDVDNQNNKSEYTSLCDVLAMDIVKKNAAFVYSSPRNLLITKGIKRINKFRICFVLPGAVRGKELDKFSLFYEYFQKIHFPFSDSATKTANRFFLGCGIDFKDDDGNIVEPYLLEIINGGQLRNIFDNKKAGILE